MRLGVGRKSGVGMGGGIGMIEIWGEFRGGLILFCGIKSVVYWIEIWYIE